MVLIAHRGDPRHAPENTLLSFRQAAARGAKTVEMDVRRCRDGTWIVFHDRFSRRPARAQGSREPVPTVTQALSLCRSKRLPVFLDIKESTREKELLALIRGSGWLSHTTLLAGRLPSLRRWRRILPHHALFWVTGFRSAVTRRKIAQANRLGLTGFVSYKETVTKAAVERVHRAGLRICVWTVRTAADFRRFARLGVDGMMSELWPPPRSI